MRIKDVVLSKGLTGFYFDDQKAIRQGNYVENGLSYDGDPVTQVLPDPPGRREYFCSAGLEDGQVAYGDCAAVRTPAQAGVTLVLSRRLSACP